MSSLWQPKPALRPLAQPFGEDRKAGRRPAVALPGLPPALRAPDLESLGSFAGALPHLHGSRAYFLVPQSLPRKPRKELAALFGRAPLPVRALSMQFCEFPQKKAQASLGPPSRSGIHPISGEWARDLGRPNQSPPGLKGRAGRRQNGTSSSVTPNSAGGSSAGGPAGRSALRGLETTCDCDSSDPAPSPRPPSRITSSATTSVV